MTQVRSSRPVSLGLTALIPFASTLVALALSGGHDAQAHGEPAASANRAVTSSEFALRQGMRSLWEDHVSWTRLAIISLTTDSPDTKATVARLLRNQSDIGNAIKPYYGAKAGNELTRLLREHILVAADLVAAARAGDKAKLATEQTAWQRNADSIAVFLNKANPDVWKLGEMKTMLHSHLTLTTQEVVARLRGKWNADVRAYDAIVKQALGMSDMLSAGIIHQFPARFAA